MQPVAALRVQPARRRPLVQSCRRGPEVAVEPQARAASGAAAPGRPDPRAARSPLRAVQRRGVAWLRAALAEEAQAGAALHGRARPVAPHEVAQVGARQAAPRVRLEGQGEGLSVVQRRAHRLLRGCGGTRRGRVSSGLRPSADRQAPSPCAALGAPGVAPGARGAPRPKRPPRPWDLEDHWWRQGGPRELQMTSGEERGKFRARAAKRTTFRSFLAGQHIWRPHRAALGRADLRGRRRRRPLRPWTQLVGRRPSAASPGPYLFPLRPLSLLGSVRRREGKNQENAVQPTQDTSVWGKKREGVYMSQSYYMPSAGGKGAAGRGPGT